MPGFPETAIPISSGMMLTRQKLRRFCVGYCLGRVGPKLVPWEFSVSGEEICLGQTALSSFACFRRRRRRKSRASRSNAATPEPVAIPAMAGVDKRGFMLFISSGIKFERISVIVGGDALVVVVDGIMISIVTDMPSPEITLEPSPPAIKPVTDGLAGVVNTEGDWAGGAAVAGVVDEVVGVTGRMVAFTTVAVFGRAPSTSSQIL